eukprot:Skav210443  [mRNA]  locus=scaffold1297:139065:141077:- [translate_table: standard]
MLLLDITRADDYRHILSQAHNDPNLAFGPAAALRCYLTQIGWDVTDRGEIRDHLHRILPLTRVSGRDISARVLTAWGIHLARDLQRRQDFSNWPAIDIPLTLKVPLPEDQREAMVLSMERTAGHIFSDQARHWEGDDFDPSSFDRCPLCDASNTRTHFPYRCPGVAGTLLANEHDFTHIKTHFPHCCFIPIAYEHPHLELVRSIHERRELPAIFDLREYGKQDNRTPVFFTDGSSIFPELPGGHLAAFSIVWDATTGDEERITCARAFRALKVWPEQLVPIQIALTPGAQTINRAELAAILQIARSCPTAIIYSDSAWAIEVFEAVRRTPVYSAHFHRANFDLVCDLVDLAISTDLGGIELHKIRSHQCYDDIHDDLQLFLALGNDKADMMAKEGTLRARSDLHQLCWEIAHWCNDQLKSLKHFSKLLVQMELQRLDAFDRRKAQQTETMNPADPNFLANWQVTNPQQLCSDDATPDNFLAGFLPGASFYLALRTWFSMLRWNDVPGDDIGISYFELACNFIGVTGICFPKVVSRGGSHTEYADERFSPDAMLLHQSVWDLTRVLEHAIRLSSKMLDVHFVPLALHQRKCFLQQYGYKGRVAGIMARPVLVEQSLHVEHMFQWAGPSGLTLPSQFSETPAFVVDVHELDELPFHQRLRAFYKLHNDSRNQ